MEGYKIIDLDNYPRKEHFLYFTSMSNPYVGVTANVDITSFRAKQKQRGLPFFLSLLYVVIRAANDVPELRRRVLHGQIVEYDDCPSSHTVAKPDGTYSYCELRSNMPLDEYLKIAIPAHERAKIEGTIEEENTEPLFFVSCLTALTYTSFVQPTPVPADFNPRITFGRYFESEGRLLLPVTLLCNHALVDGLHLSRFYEQLKKRLEQF